MRIKISALRLLKWPEVPTGTSLLEALITGTESSAMVDVDDLTCRWVGISLCIWLRASVFWFLSRLSIWSCKGATASPHRPIYEKGASGRWQTTFGQLICNFWWRDGDPSLRWGLKGRIGFNQGNGSRLIENLRSLDTSLALDHVITLSSRRRKGADNIWSAFQLFSTYGDDARIITKCKITLFGTD